MKYNPQYKQVVIKKRFINSHETNKSKELKKLEEIIVRDSNEIILIKHKISKSEKLLEGIMYKVEMRENVINKKIRE